MVRRSLYTIVETSNLFTDDEILETKINEAYLSTVFDDCTLQNQFLASCGIIDNEKRCDLCEGTPLMSYIKDKHAIDGYKWVCRRPCKNTHSIRYNSFFYNSKASFKTLFKIFYKYINGDEHIDVAYELSIDRHTSGFWASFVREALGMYMADHSEILGGYNEDGTRKIVEIDESLFCRRKYNRGRMLDNQWFVGGIERGSRKIFILPVENRNANTMAQIISNNVHSGTKIITDQWRAYGAALRGFDSMQHETINHSINFVDPMDPEIHTQNIEGLWSRSKYFLRKKRGISREKKTEYLLQFIWEYGIPKRSRFNKFLILLRFD